MVTTKQNTYIRYAKDKNKRIQAYTKETQETTKENTKEKIREKWEQSRREPCWEKVAFGLGLEERLGDPREGDVETLGWERRGAYLRQVPS